MEKKDALALVFARNSFYRVLHYLILGAFSLAVIVIGVLLWSFIYLQRNTTQPVYFATDNVSHLIKIIPLNVPNMTNADVAKWTVEAVQHALSFDYVNYRAQLQSSEKYFTPYGWTQYMTAIRANNNLVAITRRRMIAIAMAVQPPKLLVQGILGGAYAWKFQIPILMTYMLPPFDDKSKFANSLQVTVIVQRQQVLKGYKGLGIVQIIANLAQAPLEKPQEISSTSTGA